MAILRKDDWVQNAQGDALAGALVYICNQPANTGTIPPSPLATVYIDTIGTVGPNPVITDGLGHWYAYLNSGVLYTIVITHFLLSSPIILPDQNLGSAPASITLLSGIPSGAIDGTNVTFTLPFTPVVGSLVMLNYNGVTLVPGLGYTISGNTITMAIAPQPGDILYYYAISPS